ncbi:MAG TPA: TraB/GumN family protein [Ramlibacter sp.]
MASLPRLFLRMLVAALLLLAGTAGAQAPGCPPAPPSPARFDMEEQARQAPDRGLLWQVEKDGRTSWLYGTVHVSRIDWRMPGPRTRAALAGSDVVALELDPADPELQRLLTRPTDAARSERVLAGLKPRLSRLATRACIPPQGMAAMPPLLQLMTVSLFEGRRDGLHPELAVDGVLWGMAQDLGKPFVPLETAAGQLAALTPQTEADERVLVLRGLQDLESGEDRAVILRLLRAWSEGDEATLASYPQWCKCLETPAEQRFYRRVNDERNDAIADRLAALHATGQRFFAGVGALHMTGPKSLAALLRARGFEVRRIVFTPAATAP